MRAYIAHCFCKRPGAGKAVKRLPCRDPVRVRRTHFPLLFGPELPTGTAGTPAVPLPAPALSDLALSALCAALPAAPAAPAAPTSFLTDVDVFVVVGTVGYVPGYVPVPVGAVARTAIASETALVLLPDVLPPSSGGGGGAAARGGGVRVVAGGGGKVGGLPVDAMPTSRVVSASWSGRGSAIHLRIAE